MTPFCTLHFQFTGKSDLQQITFSHSREQYYTGSCTQVYTVQRFNLEGPNFGEIAI